MKKLLSAIFIFCASFVYASDTPLLDHFMGLETLTADFVQENQYAGIDSYTHNGKLYMVRPEKALWDYKDPVEFYLLTPGEILQYSAELKQAVKVHVDTTRDGDLSGLLMSIFLNSSDITTSFKVSEDDNNITLVPKRNIGVKKVIITMEKGRLKSVYAEDSGENTVNIKFNKVVENKSVNMKVFDKKLPDETEFFVQ